MVVVITIYREKGRCREGRELVKGEVELKMKVWHITLGGSIEEGSKRGEVEISGV